MITGIIPKNLFDVDQKGNLQKIKFIEVKKYSHNEYYLIDQYYLDNFAVSRKINEQELNAIEKFQEGDAIELYLKVFPHKKNI